MASFSFIKSEDFKALTLDKQKKVKGYLMSRVFKQSRQRQTHPEMYIQHQKYLEDFRERGKSKFGAEILQEDSDDSSLVSLEKIKIQLYSVSSSPRIDEDSENQRNLPYKSENTHKLFV